ncbi:uncharacterized protein LOC113960060, partial [Corapipo altera]|uniref:uncharacterized protein LOC113960060 n=1 Tax=Corapipo altera TaxID=415028 RepID=UPI000FD6859C
MLLCRQPEREPGTAGMGITGAKADKDCGKGARHRRWAGGPREGRALALGTGSWNRVTELGTEGGGSSPPFPLTSRLYPCKIILGAQPRPETLFRRSLSCLPVGHRGGSRGESSGFGVGRCLGSVPGGDTGFLSPPQIQALGQDGVLQALVLGEGQCSDPGISEEQHRAQEEWEALEEIQSALGGISPVPPPSISFAEALQHFQSSGLSQSRRKVRGPGRR